MPPPLPALGKIHIQIFFFSFLLVMNNLPVLIVIQKELLKLLLDDEILKNRFQNVYNSKENIEHKENNNSQFVGFIIRHKVGTKDACDIGFSLKKFETWVRSNQQDHTNNNEKHFISTYEFNKEKDVLSVTLHRENILKTLQQQRWRQSFHRNGDDGNEKHVFKCHLVRKVDSVANIRTLLYSFFMKRFLLHMRGEDGDILCEIKSYADVTTCENQSLVLTEKAIESIHQELSTKNINFEKSNYDQCEPEVEITKSKLNNYLSVVDEEMVFDGKKWLEDKTTKKSGFAKDISFIPLLNTDHTPTSYFRDAVDMQEAFVDSEAIVHLVVNQKLVSAQKSALVYQAISGDEKQKFCTFEEQPAALMGGYLQARKDELFASYRSKYGRVVNGAQWEDTIKQVAVSSLILDIFSLSLNNQLKIASVKDISCLSSRKSLFILYNYARISQLLEQFDEKVRDGVYEALPDIDDIDFSLLTEDAEWQIILQYILYYPNLMLQLHCHFDQNTSHRLHLSTNQLCQFLCDLCHDFSSYYHQTKVLLDPHPHLYRLIYARLYFVKIIKEMMCQCFQLLGVTPPQQM